MSVNDINKNLLDKLPNGVKLSLSPGEQVFHYLVTFEVVERPDYIILTNHRILFYNEKHLGRYDYRSIPFQKLLEMNARRGRLLWGSISLKGEDETVISLERVDREELESFINKLKNLINEIAVEPVSIEYRKNLFGEATWQFNKPTEMVFRQQTYSQQQPSEDPISKLKMMFVNNEISEEEYRKKLKVLQET